jgi:hypothetical protein
MNGSKHYPNSISFNPLLIQILVYYCHSEIFQQPHIFKESVSFLYTMSLPLHSGGEIATYEYI